MALLAMKPDEVRPEKWITAQSEKQKYPTQRNTGGGGGRR